LFVEASGSVRQCADLPSAMSQAFQSARAMTGLHTVEYRAHAAWMASRLEIGLQQIRKLRYKLRKSQGL